jgi:hypothetical protein
MGYTAQLLSHYVDKLAKLPTLNHAIALAEDHNAFIRKLTFTIGVHYFDSEPRSRACPSRMTN